MEIGVIISLVVAVVLIVLAFKKLYNAFFNYIWMLIGVAIAIFGIVATVNGVIFGLLGIPFGIALAWRAWGNIRDEHRSSFSSSSSSSSSFSSEPKRYPHIKPPSDDESSLKTPDDSVGYMIASEIERRLRSVTPSTGLYCDVYGSGTAYLRGGITLWHADEANRIQDAIQEGFNKALEKAYKDGYDVSSISGLDTSGVTIDAADLH